VHQIFCIAISELLKEESCIQQDIHIPGGVVLKDHPCFVLQEKIIWGATALILNEVRMMLG
jgi:hypothetical protein